MLYIFAGIVLFLLVIFSFGYPIVFYLDKNRVMRFDIVFFISIAIGVFIFGSLMVLISLFCAVQWPALIIAVPTSVWSCIFLYKRGCDSKKAMLFAGTLVIVTVMLSFICVSVEIKSYDAGLYHLSAIKWIVEYGTVKGIALLHSRLGFTSLWFYVIAPFKSLFTVLHGYSIANLAVTTCMAAETIYLFIIRIFTKEADNFDYLTTFCFAGIFLSLPRYSSCFPFSPSPDWGLNFMQLIGFLTLCFRISIKNSVSHENQRFITKLAFLISLGAFAVKFNAIILVFASTGYFVWDYRKLLMTKQFIVTVFIASVLLIPFFVARVITSGCLLYPSTLFCFDLPWSVGVENAKAMGDVITNWARGTQLHDSSDTFLGWLKAFTTGELKSHGFIGRGVFLYVSIISGVSLILFRWENRRFWIVPLCTAFFGLGFVLYKAPDERFAGVYMVMSMALIGSEIFLIFSKKISYKLWRLGILTLIFCGLIGIKTTGAGDFFIYHFKIDKSIKAVLEKPLMSMTTNSEIKKIELIEVKSGNFSYYSAPKGTDQLWATPLPNSPYRGVMIYLTDETKGISAGFVKEREESP